MKLYDLIEERFQITTIWKFLKEFCANSTVHGVRYFTEQRRHWSERFWWIFAFSLAMGLCSSTIQDTWTKWHVNPMIMSIAEKEASITEIAFPTITICSQTKALKSKLDWISIFGTKKPHNITNTERSRLMALDHICSNTMAPKLLENAYENEQIYITLTDTAPPLEYILAKYIWQRKSYGYEQNEHFVSVLTELGLCFAFNSINLHEIYTEQMAPGMMMVKSNPNVYQWSLDNGYTHETNEKEYPLRLFNFGDVSGLLFVLFTDKEHLEYFCEPFLGYTVILSAPGDFLRISQSSFRVPLFEDSFISIKPKLITTSEGLRSFSPNQRQCFYSSERQLRFFKMYTQANCEAECLANFTKKECGCVKFHMPNVETNICGGINIGCYTDAESNLFREIKTGNSNDGTPKSFLSECNCLPACTSIEYDADITNIKFDKDVAAHTFGEIARRLPTRFKIFFKKYQVKSLKRKEVYTYVDFMAICGGLLGLFLGMSALSIIEFIYYFTLRLFWTIRRSQSENFAVRFVRTTSGNINE